jgi:hypothetical protein
MTEADWTAFVRLNEQSGIGTLSLERLQRAMELLDAPVPGPVMEALGRMPGVRGEAAGSLQSIFASVKALPAWRDRVSLIRQHLLPSPHYMREVYAPASRAPLTALYLDRVVRGAWKYWRRS